MDGLNNSELQSRGMAVIGDDFWLATGNGLKVAKIRDLLRDDYPAITMRPSLIVTDHLLSEADLSDCINHRTIRLSRSNGDFMLQFSPNVFADNRGMRYICRLEGYDDWHLLDNNDRYLIYRGLRPGTYRLRVQALGMPEVSMSFKVVVPLSWTALVLLVFVFLVLVFGAHVYYCHRKHKPYIWEAFTPKPQKYTTNKLDLRESKRIVTDLRRCMDEKKPYLNPSLQVADLAKMIGCSAHTLTQVITQVMKTKYYDLLAEYRVREVQRILADPQYAHYTMAALSEKCGFRSRNTFLVAFKKFVGMSPSEYVKQLRK
jgi:AraC-like DNA-binding protein